MTKKKQRNWGDFNSKLQDAPLNGANTRIAAAANTQENELPADSITSQILLSQIRIEEGHNPRSRAEVLKGIEEFAETFRAVGQIESILVRPNPNGPGYLIVSGERRYEAAKLLGWHTIRATIKNASQLPPEKRLLSALIENLSKKSMVSDDIALSVQREVETTGESKSSIAKRLGKPNSWITECLSHASLIEEFPFIRGKAIASSVAYKFQQETQDYTKGQKEAALRSLLEAGEGSIKLTTLQTKLSDENAEFKPERPTKRKPMAVDLSRLHSFKQWNSLPRDTRRKCESAFKKYAKAQQQMEQSAQKLKSLNIPKKHWPST